MNKQQKGAINLVFFQEASQTNNINESYAFYFNFAQRSESKPFFPRRQIMEVRGVEQ